jgi:hypothetical protein
VKTTYSNSPGFDSLPAINVDRISVACHDTLRKVGVCVEMETTVLFHTRLELIMVTFDAM